MTSTSSTTSLPHGYLVVLNGSEITTSSLNLTGIVATSATSTTSFATTTSTFDDSLVVAPLFLTEEDDAVVAVSVIGSLISLGAALFSGLFLLKKYGLVKLSFMKALKPSRLCSRWKTKVKSIEETATKGEADMQDARRTSGWPPQPEVSIPAVQGGEELLVKLQDFFKARAATGAGADATALPELLEQWKKSMAFGEAQVTIAEIVKEVLSDPVALNGDDPFVSLERFDPVIQNAWQKHVRSADQLPQEKREELFEAGEDLIRIVRRTVNAKSAPDAVLKDLIEVRQEWRNRWPFEDPAAAVAIQSIEMAVTSAVIQKIHGQTPKSSRPESSTVELRDPHSLDAELPEPEDAAEPKMEKSKSLKERLEELSSNSKQKTVEMKLRTAGDQLLVELSNVLETREAFPAEAVSKTVTQWQQRQVGLLPDAAANVAQMAQLARSVISRAPGKDFAGLRAAIEEAWKQGKIPDTMPEAMAESSPVDVNAAAMKSAEVLEAGEELLAQLEHRSLQSRSLETPELNAICEEWKIEQLKAQGVVVESETGRLVEGLADFLKTSMLRSAVGPLGTSQVREAVQVLKATEALLEQLTTADPQDLEADLLKLSENWKQQQLGRLDGNDEAVKRWVESRVAATNLVLKQEAQSVDGMLGQINIEKLRPQLQELWLESAGPKTLGHLQPDALPEAAPQGSAFGDRVVDVVQSGEAFSEAREELFREVTKDGTKSVEELVRSWQQDLASVQVAHLTSGLAKVVTDAAALGQLKNVEVLWHKQMEKVLQDSGRLMKDLDNILKSSFARLGDDLSPDVKAECDSWTSKQLASQKLAPDSGLADLYRGFAEVVHSVAVNAEEVTVAKADSSFEGLKGQIQDAWRQRMGDTRGQERGPEPSKSQDAEMQLEKIKPSKVLKDGEKLLRNLEDVFRCSWARPGEDLMPEILKQCNEWTNKQVQAGGTKASKAMYQGFAEAVQSVVQVHAVDDKVVGDAEFFQKLETDIKETWKQRNQPAQAAMQETAQHVKQSNELSKDRRAPKTERHGKSQAVQDAKQFLQEMEALFEDGVAMDASRLMERGQAWRQERLRGSNLTQDSEMGVWLQSLMDTMQSVLREGGGTISSEDFARLQPQIVDKWKHQLHGAQHVHFDSQSQGRGRSLPRDAKQSNVDFAKEDLKNRLEALMKDPPEMLQQKVEELVQSWQQRQVTDDVDAITASLLQSLAQTARHMAAAGASPGQVAPLFEEAWKAQQWLTWCPPSQAEVGQAGAELLTELRRMRPGSQSDWRALLESQLEQWQEKHKQLPLQGLAEAARNVTIHQVNSGRRDSALLVERVQLAWQQQMEGAPRNTARSGRSSRSSRPDERGASEGQAETKKRSRSRPKEGRPPEAPRRSGARSTERKPAESMDILDRLKDGGMEVAPEVDSLQDLVRPSMSVERGFQNRELSRTSRNSNSPHPSSHYGDFEMPSRGSSVHADYRGNSPSPAPTNTADLLRLKYSRPARMAGASMVKVQR